MKKEELVNATFPDCPVRNVISHITDKWSLLVLYVLEQQEVLRFNDLWRQIPDISQKMLTSTLRHLEEDGIVIREVFPEVPPRVEYRLSDRGKSYVCNTGILGNVFTVEHFDPIKYIPNGVFLSGFFSNFPSKEIIDSLFDLINRNHIKSLYSKVFRLDQIAEAHALLEKGCAGGKIILSVNPANS